MKRTDLKTGRALLSFTLAFVVYASLVAGSIPALEKASARATATGQLDAELHQALLDLTNPWTVMCVAAHPDDEDGATLTVLRRKLGVHTVSLFSTYGEGGQNATGPELYEELGVIRARETEEASMIQGSEAHFLGLKDFGFSKSAEEAFRIWGKEEALRRMVLKIRELRPDVIITNHDTTSGHGHHQATGRLVLEAFEAAANPARFPEQLRGGRLQPWQAQRLFVRFSFAQSDASKAAENEAQSAGRVITIDRNERDPVRGLTYAEQALQALRRHATQGPWPERIPPAGWPPIRYRLALEAKNAAKLPVDAQTFLDNLTIPDEPVSKVVPLAAQAVLPLYESQKASPESVLRSLIALRRSNVFVAPPGTKDKARFQLMSERLDKALAVASGVSAELKPADDSPLIPGTRRSFELILHNRGETSVQIKRDSFTINGRVLESSTAPSSVPGHHSLRRSDISYDVPQTALVNVPQSEHLYDGRLSGAEFGAEFLLELDGAPFKVRATRRFNITPPVEIESISPSPLVVTPQTIDRNYTFTFRLNNHTTETYDVRVSSKDLTYPGRAAEPRGVRIPGRTVLDKEVQYMLSSENTFAVRGRGALDTTARFSLYRVNPVPAQDTLITSRDVKVVYADARVDAALRVGYVRSTGYTLPAALAALGVQSKELTIDEISSGDLSGYDAIIIDNRGYQAHPELVQQNQKLLDYVERGGTLIVFYHRTNEWNPDDRVNRKQLAPYPILLGNSRVTDENAPVTFTDPQHPLLNFPNKITASDFQGWIQERGLYFPREWDKRYSAPLSMSDAGEPQLQGGLLAAEHGRGRYIYTSIVWYRQLGEGHAGAYRVLANMISYGSQNNGSAKE